MQSHHQGIAFVLVAAAFLTAGIILATTLATAGPNHPTETGSFLLVVGLPIALMMGVAALVAYLMLNFILGSLIR